MDKEKETKKLKKQVKILNRALDLACEKLKYFEEMLNGDMEHFELFGYNTKYSIKDLKNFYIKKTIGEFKNENIRN